LALPPLFSRRIIETSMSCPPRMKLEGAVEKSVLKKAVRDIVPEPIIARPKVGMMVPVRFWFQGDMRRYGEKLLARKNLQRIGLFNPDYVKRLINYEMEGVPGLRHGLKLWMLITFLLWHEQMVEAPLPVQSPPSVRNVPPA
jgi:asparagine synthase (glutamine-hydrolysing)